MGQKIDIMTMLRLLCSLLVLISTSSLASAKVKRVKEGKVYQKHDEVHVVVNKVGYVGNPFEIMMRDIFRLCPF